MVDGCRFVDVVSVENLWVVFIFFLKLMFEKVLFWLKVLLWWLKVWWLLVVNFVLGWYWFDSRLFVSGIFVMMLILVF